MPSTIERRLERARKLDRDATSRRAAQVARAHRKAYTKHFGTTEANRVARRAARMELARLSLAGAR